MPTMNLSDLDFDQVRYVVLDAMDTILPRGDRLEETEAYLKYLKQRHPGQAVTTDAEKYRATIKEFEEISPPSVSLAREAITRVEAANLRVADREAIILFDGITDVIAGMMVAYDGLKRTVRMIQASTDRSGTHRYVLLFSTALHLGKVSLVKTGITSCFDRTYFSVDIGMTKIADDWATRTGTEGFEYVCENEKRLQGIGGWDGGTPHGRAFVMVDDDITHCRNARKAGIQAIVARTAEGHSADIDPSDIELPWLSAVSDLQPLLS